MSRGRYRIAMIGVRGLASAPPPQFIDNGRYAVGGAELAAEELAVRLARRGHDVTLFARGGTRRRAANQPSIEPTWFVPGRRTEALSHSLWSTVLAIRARADIVHFHAVGPGSCAVLTRVLGVPSVLTVQGLDWQREKWLGWEQRILQGLATLGIRHASACVTVAPSLSQPVKEFGARAVEFIPNGFSEAGAGDPALLEAFGVRPGAYFLCLSRLVPEKNLHLIIDAYRRADVSWPLVIAGGASETDEYVAELKRRAAGSGRVHLVGVVRGPAKAALLEHAGAFLNASSVEGLSLALVEALGYGVPIGISPIPQNLDVFAAVPGAPSPVLLDTEAPGAMASSLRRLESLSEPERATWREAAVRVQRTFSWDDIASRTEALYDRLMSVQRA